MAELKTKPNDASVEDFINSVESEQRRRDCFEILGLMAEVTVEKPVLWGDSVVGFGTHHQIFNSGHERDWFLTGFSPRKANIVLYLMAGFHNFENLLQKLGKFKTGTNCLYIKSIADIDKSVLRQLIRDSVDYTSKLYQKQ